MLEKTPADALCRRSGGLDDSREAPLPTTGRRRAASVQRSATSESGPSAWARVRRISSVNPHRGPEAP